MMVIMFWQQNPL